MIYDVAITVLTYYVRKYVCIDPGLQKTTWNMFFSLCIFPFPLAYNYQSLYIHSHMFCYVRSFICYFSASFICLLFLYYSANSSWGGASAIFKWKLIVLNSIQIICLFHDMIVRQKGRFFSNMHGFRTFEQYILQIWGVLAIRLHHKTVPYKFVRNNLDGAMRMRMQLCAERAWVESPQNSTAFAHRSLSIRDSPARGNCAVQSCTKNVVHGNVYENEILCGAGVGRIISEWYSICTSRVESWSLAKTINSSSGRICTGRICTGQICTERIRTGRIRIAPSRWKKPSRNNKLSFGANLYGAKLYRALSLRKSFTNIHEHRYCILMNINIIEVENQHKSGNWPKLYTENYWISTLCWVVI